MSTIKDVARHCGVSIATVSAVINEASWVSAATREKVVRSIEALRYRPNNLARSLKSRRSGTLGILVSDLSDALSIEVVRAVEHVIREGGLNLFVCDSDRQTALGETNFQMLLEKQVDGLILIGPAVEAALLAEHLRTRHATPVVAVDHDRAVRGITRLLVDYERASYDATMHLVQQGHRNIAFAGREGSGMDDSGAEGKDRLGGYQRALTEAGIEIRDEYVQTGEHNLDLGRRAVEVLASLPTPPSGLIATHDLVALGAMRRAHELGLSVPGKLSIVGCGDIAAASVVTPSLTSMHIPTDSIGRDAGVLLQDFMSESRAWTTSTRHYGARLVQRESTARTR